MKLYKLQGNYGWILYNSLGELDTNGAESVYKNYYDSYAILKSCSEIRLDYPYVLMGARGTI